LELSCPLKIYNSCDAVINRKRVWLPKWELEMDFYDCNSERCFLLLSFATCLTRCLICLLLIRSSVLSISMIWTSKTCVAIADTRVFFNHFISFYFHVSIKFDSVLNIDSPSKGIWNRDKTFEYDVVSIKNWMNNNNVGIIDHIYSYMTLSKLRYQDNLCPYYSELDR